MAKFDDTPQAQTRPGRSGRGGAWRGTARQGLEIAHANPGDETMELLAVGDIAELTRHLRCISMRLARFEDVSQDELDAFQAHKQAVLAKIREDQLL